jgi:serine phosphatase RsbU (regulator of sigma subunit)
LRRLSDSFDAFSVVGKGSAFYMCLWSGIVERSSITLEIGRIAVPILYEEVCGDGWAVSSSQDSATLLLTDGLGHGVLAAQASQAATQLLAKRPNLQPLAFVEAAHAALRGTRGAALAVAELRFKSEELNFVGIGNISACVIDGLARKQLVSHNGIVGHNMRKVQQFSIPCPAGSLYVMHSDGINTHWDLNDYPGLSLRHPALIAGIIYRDFTRARDDASVLASRFRLHS